MASEEQKAFPLKRQEALKWNGWGYRDSKIQFDTEKNICHFVGDRYDLSGHNLPALMDWFEQSCKADRSYTTPAKPLDLSSIPEPVRCEPFLEEAKYCCKMYSEDPEDRLMHGHGHLVEEIFRLRHGRFDRIPDLVVYPSCHDDVVKLVELACKYHVVLIPMGGGTSVSGALLCPESEERSIVSLDMTAMDRIHWIDPENLVAHIEAGIIGQDLERKLEKEGYTTGHQPDSLEFSSLGGWVATRASGMKKNIYGNIEDLVVRLRMVTAKGTIEKSCQVPRMSTGPDIHQFILGSEGTLGVITEVTMKIRPLPECVRYGSVIFPDFESGIKCLHEVSKKRICPASIRLMDNSQLQFGMAIKPDKNQSIVSCFMDKVKKAYITKLRGFKENKMCVCTLLFEGQTEAVAKQESSIYTIAGEHGGIPAGEEHGKSGYQLTFSIAYLRDLAMDYGYLAESFETSVPWDRVSDLIKNVRQRINIACKEAGVPEAPYTSARVTQAYDAGACIYFYFGFLRKGLEDPLESFIAIENAAREEVLANGGSLSHHHGVGKVRRKWLKDTVSEVGMGALKSLKKELDPHNIFGSGNLIGVVGPTIDSKL